MSDDAAKRVRVTRTTHPLSVDHLLIQTRMGGIRLRGTTPPPADTHGTDPGERPIRKIAAPERRPEAA
ncbi:MAG: hypothetical protein ACYTGR_17995 [Planctomycetota bacterium]|jgi:hypothetical protein